jgi:hypothetical protein
VHDCRVCRQVRLEPARAAGADATVLAKVQSYETSDLSKRHRVVLRSPMLICSASLADEVATHLTAEEAVDIVMFVAKCSYQKSLVALGLDTPGRYTWFDFDAQTGATSLCSERSRPGWVAWTAYLDAVDIANPLTRQLAA